VGPAVAVVGVCGGENVGGALGANVGALGVNVGAAVGYDAAVGVLVGIVGCGVDGGEDGTHPLVSEHSLQPPSYSPSS